MISNRVLHVQSEAGHTSIIINYKIIPLGDRIYNLWTPKLGETLINETHLNKLIQGYTITTIGYNHDFHLTLRKV